ncbi:MAG: ribosomal protein S18-alanine N-acetyltransferase [Acutalibacteraceae bacterium]
MTEIVKMSSAHVAGVAKIEKECFSAPWSEKALSEELTNDVSHFFVCLDENEVVGYAGVHIMSGECYIDNIAVSASHRRQKIGSLLIEKLIDTAKREGGEFISLEVRQSNKPAICLYEKFGFVSVGARKDFYDFPTEDAIIMTKTFL